MATDAGKRRRDGSLVDGAMETIRSQILLEKLAAGERLPPERVLVEELGVSRTVLREALSSLEALGLIETRGTRGRVVAQGGSSERGRSIVSAWLHQHAREILEVDEIRSVLEAQAIRSMSEWAAIDAAREAGAILARQESALERGESVVAAEGDDPPYDGIAITTFDTREDAKRAFAVPELAEGLRRTRDEFAASVDVYFAEEYPVVTEQEE